MVRALSIIAFWALAACAGSASDTQSNLQSAHDECVA